MPFKTLLLAFALVIGSLNQGIQATPSTPIAESGLTSPDSIRAFIISELEDADICTKKWMDEAAYIHFTLDEYGKVLLQDVQTNDAKLKACIEAKLSHVKLPVPHQQTSQTYTIKVNFRVV